MADDREDFLRRWSRRKQAAAVPKAPAPRQDEALPALPSIDSLTFESDFKAFMHAKVEDSVKRAALKKLFSDPRLNVIDYMDVYIDDYTNLETIPQEMLAKLEHAKATLFGPQPEKPAEPAPPEKIDVAQAPTETETPKAKEDDGAAG
jgi:hypothetical protein